MSAWYEILKELYEVMMLIIENFTFEISEQFEAWKYFIKQSTKCLNSR